MWCFSIEVCSLQHFLWSKATASFLNTGDIYSDWQLTIPHTAQGLPGSGPCHCESLLSLCHARQHSVGNQYTSAPIWPRPAAFIYYIRQVEHFCFHLWWCSNSSLQKYLIYFLMTVNYSHISLQACYDPAAGLYSETIWCFGFCEGDKFPMFQVRLSRISSALLKRTFS